NYSLYVQFSIDNRRKQGASEPYFSTPSGSSSHLGASLQFTVAHPHWRRQRFCVRARSISLPALHAPFQISLGLHGREPARARELPQVRLRGEVANTGVRAAASSVLKFDIAVLFNRHLLERFHRAFQQRDVVGNPRLAVETAARGLGARDTLLLLADLATRQMFEGRGRNVGWGNIIGLACARARERGESSGNVCAKAHDFARSGLWVEGPALSGIVSSAKAEKISRHFFPFNSLISVTSSGNG